MANKNLFMSSPGKLVPATDTTNLAGGKAYSLPDKHALAQMVTTGCLNSTFYASAEAQLDNVLSLCRKVDPTFVAKAAVYGREYGYMKDMPALLCAHLSYVGSEKVILNKIFDRVIDNGKMLRNFVQIVRSGVVGRKSLGSMPKRLVKEWLHEKTAGYIFRNSIGNDPSMADIIKMVHPKPESEEKKALYAYLIGKEYNFDSLPGIVQEFEKIKEGVTKEIPSYIPFQMLTSLKLGEKEWKSIAGGMNWTTTRMNINTLMRHGVFNDKEMVKLIADRLSDTEEIKKAKAFPYQLLTTYLNISSDIPIKIKEALQDAMEVAVENVPSYDCNVAIFPDVSGSMSSAVTGYRKGSTSVTRCIDVAALVTSAILRRNREAIVLPFEGRVVDRLTINPRDSVMTNAKKLAGIRGGSTNCSAPLQRLVEKKIYPDLCIFVSDSESWVGKHFGTGTSVAHYWSIIKLNNPKTKLVCINLTPNKTSQIKDQKDVLNIGGFSDTVFDIINLFVKDQLSADHWVGVIEQVKL